MRINKSKELPPVIADILKEKEEAAVNAIIDIIEPKKKPAKKKAKKVAK